MIERGIAARWIGSGATRADAKRPDLGGAMVETMRVEVETCYSQEAGKCLIVATGEHKELDKIPGDILWQKEAQKQESRNRLPRPDQ